MFISIDGSSRRNGKQNCNAAGSAYIHDKGVITCMHEIEGSTNQRGELMGLISGLKAAIAYANDYAADDFVVVTDSEYLWNMIQKGWHYTWARNNWTGSSGDVIKNKDLIEHMHNLRTELDDMDIDIVAIHIKGHLVSLGDVTAKKLLDADPTGKMLYDAASDKYEKRKETHAHLFEHAYDVFKRNQDYMLDEETFKKLVLMNTVADYAASLYMNKVDSAYHAEKAD